MRRLSVVLLTFQHWRSLFQKTVYFKTIDNLTDKDCNFDVNLDSFLIIVSTYAFV